MSRPGGRGGCQIEKLIIVVDGYEGKKLGTEDTLLGKWVDPEVVLAPLLDLLEDGVVIHDEQRKIYLVNRATEEILGRNRDDVVGIDCHEAFPPNGLCGAACAFKGDPPYSENRREHSITFRRLDGEERRIKVRSDPILIGGEKRGVVAVIRDVSEISNLRWRLNRRREFHGMVGSSEYVSEVFDTIRSVATSDYPVLISGESGTGKELAAGAVHKESRRKGGPFVPINCGALPENILESELFGHVRGAFTGAIRDRKGRFELADGGTLFLDEVGELPKHVQVKLLRVLQEKSFERVGGEKSLTVDVRIIAATNRNLRQMVQEGEFREDLFYRLCVVPIELPPLRERSEDIPYLVDKILQDIQKETEKKIAGVDDRAMDLLVSFNWPGNVRELINALQYAAIRCKEDVLRPEYLPYEVRFPRTDVIAPARERASSSHVPLANSEENADSILVRRTKLTKESVSLALTQAGGNKVKAAKLLGVGRATLYRFLDKNNL